MSVPFTGRDLIALGYTPGRAFQEAIQRVNAEGLRIEAADEEPQDEGPGF